MFARTLSLTHIIFKNDFTITTLLHLVENMVHLILNESLTATPNIESREGGHPNFIIPVTRIYINRNQFVTVH